MIETLLQYNITLLLYPEVFSITGPEYEDEKLHQPTNLILNSLFEIMVAEKTRQHSFVYLKNLLTKIIDEEEDAIESISYSLFQRLLDFSKKGNILDINPIKISLDFLILICEFKPVA